MATFHKVTTRISEKRKANGLTETTATMNYSGTVEATYKPEGTYRETTSADIYEDFFNTKEEAERFIETQTTYGR